MAREYFCAYHSLRKTVEQLGDAERGRLFMACLEYSETGIEPELRGNERFVFPSIRAQIDRDNEKYQKKCEVNRENGKLGGEANATERYRTPSERPPREREREREIEKKDILSDIQKKDFGEFGHVKLTDGQYAKLTERYAQNLVDDKIAYLDGNIQSRVKKYMAYKDHYATIGNWCRKDAPPVEPKPDYTIKPDANKQTFREGATWDEILDTLDN